MYDDDGHAGDGAGRASVVLVDDNAAVRRALSAVLRDGGYRVADAAGGQEALRILDADGADILVTDLLMPEMDGIELIREVRRGNPDLPILALSGGGLVPADACLDMVRLLFGAPILRKPVDADVFLQAVGSALRAARPVEAV